VALSAAADWLDVIPQLVAASDVIFASAEMADRTGTIDIDRVWHIARIVSQLSTVYANGFGNLYFTATANCLPGSPFFPVATNGGGVHFALALESADIVLNALSTAPTLPAARHALVNAIESAAAEIADAARLLAARFGVPFSGIDFSLAPFPTADRSLGGALASLGVSLVGASGTLFAAAFVADALQRADFARTGFCGLMLPLLEDSALANSAAAGRLGIAELLSYSAVCGVGLDTLPLPGAASPAHLAAILLDVAALASRLDKQLTARLMPLPGLSAGDPVTFDFPYFADSRVLSLSSDGVHGLLQAPATLTLMPISRRP
jgi:uncharacterized protein (UPF0210 family)